MLQVNGVMLYLYVFQMNILYQYESILKKSL